LNPNGAEAHLWLAESLRMNAKYQESTVEYHEYLRLSDFDSKLAGKLNYYVLGYLTGFGKKKRANLTDIWRELRSEAYLGLSDDERIAMISGCNTISRRFAPKGSYFFSRYSLFWGWASWRHAWQRHDVKMKGWPTWRDQGALANLPGGSRMFEAYWRRNFDAAYNGKIDTWDYQWTFSCWKMGRLSIVPARNQTRNLGFGADATHTTTGTPSYVSESAPLSLHFPLIHPESVARNDEADAIIDKYVYKINRFKIVQRKILSYPIANTLLRALRKYGAGYGS